MKKVRAVVLFCAALGWWGAVYPQFTMVKGTYRIVYEEDEPQGLQNAAEERDGGDVYWEIMRADRGRIRFRSRLFTELGALRSYLRGGCADSEGE